MKTERRRRNLPADIPDQEALEGKNAEMRTTMKGTEKEGPQKTEGTKGMLGMEEMEEMAEDKTQEETDDC